jgi:hypothetical protein
MVYICKPGILKPPSGLRESPGSGKRKKVPVPPGTFFEVLLQKKPQIVALRRQGKRFR